MKTIRDIGRVLLGITFIFSGFVKGIDFLGSTYKFTDYFNAFGAEWATNLSFVLAILQSMFEFGVGIALTLNYRLKLFSWLSFIFMAFFLPFTLYIAIKNPVTDCGCFGDAIIITNWQTFFKNIILFGLALLVLLERKKYVNKYNIHFQNGYFVFFMLVFGTIAYHSYNHLPIIDFSPYKIGKNIREGMETPVGAPTDVYKNTFIYRNKTTGGKKRFDETNYPWKDTLNWEFVSTKSKLVKKGYHAPIHDFTIENAEGEDFKGFYLADPGYTFVLVSYDLDKARTRKQKKINELAAAAINQGYHFICLTASSTRQIDEFKEKEQPPYEFFFCDEITLKTIIRSNPGLLLLKNGTVIDKWHWRDVPSFEKLQKKMK